MRAVSSVLRTCGPHFQTTQFSVVLCAVSASSGCKSRCSKEHPVCCRAPAEHPVCCRAPAAECSTPCRRSGTKTPPSPPKGQRLGRAGVQCLKGCATKAECWEGGGISGGSSPPSAPRTPASSPPTPPPPIHLQPCHVMRRSAAPPPPTYKYQRDKSRLTCLGARRGRPTRWGRGGGDPTRWGRRGGGDPTR